MGEFFYKLFEFIILLIIFVLKLLVWVVSVPFVYIVWIIREIKK